ncbi:MAG: aminotransferase class I/II-fold pyridoxal phosphate-dependent enzyme [Candidatus Ancillula sp.]|jgi:cystathionine beta-lyase|nr:aminotransferase class I/II-fold pyridoxal phosphate-dependent enzyme [Candidatus Ancillula sp.]
MNPLEQYSLEELRLRTSEKWTNYSPDVLPLWVAEMDIKLPEELVGSITQIIKRGDLGYLSKVGFERYVNAFCSFADRHWGWKPDTKMIVDVPDVVRGCTQVINAYLEHNPDNSVIVSTPIYPPFINGYAKGYKYIDAPLTPLYFDGKLSDNPFRLDFEALEVAFKNSTTNSKKAVYALCNPSNPTGTVHTPDELRQLANLSSKYGVLVVSDEIHGPLVTARNFELENHVLSECSNPANHGKHSAFTPYLSLQEADLAITVCSASKAFSIPGVKAALVIASSHPSNKARDLLFNSGHFSKANSEHLGVLAQTICLNQCDEWLYHLVQAIRNNISYFESLSKQYFPLAKYACLGGTYFAWVDFGEYVKNGSIPEDISPAKYFLDNAKVAFNPGNSFATPIDLTFSGLQKVGAKISASPYDNFVRINLATSQEIIRMALESVGSIL